MSLNIKNPETHRLAEELAKRTGESMTAAVTTAVRERLDRVRREQGASLADRLLEIGQDCAKRLKEPFRSADHDELLYDDRGLPRSSSTRLRLSQSFATNPKREIARSRSRETRYVACPPPTSLKPRW